MKYCTNCGAQLNDEANFCPSCGKAAESKNTTETPDFSASEQPAVIPSVSDSSAEDTSAEQTGMASSMLTKAIVSLACSEWPIASIVGIVFGAQERHLAREYRKKFGIPHRKAKVAEILGNVGFGVSIGFTVFWAIYSLFLFIYLILVALMVSGIH